MTAKILEFKGPTWTKPSDSPMKLFATLPATIRDMIVYEGYLLCHCEDGNIYIVYDDGSYELLVES